MKTLVAVVVLALTLVACEGTPQTTTPTDPDATVSGTTQAPAAQPVTLISTKTCNAQWTPENNPHTFELEHVIYTFSDGSVTTSCNVSSGNQDGSGFAIYKGSDPAAVSATCVVKLDVDAPTGGGFTFDAAHQWFTYLDQGASSVGTMTCEVR